MPVNPAYILVYVALLLTGRFIAQSQRKSEHPIAQTQKIAKDPTAMLMAISVAAGFGAPLFEASLHPRWIPVWLSVSGILVMAGGFLIAYSANRAIAENWSPVIDKTRQQRLVQSGIYSRVRHPLYASGLLLISGTNLYFGSTWSWLTLILALIVTVVRIPLEEKELIARFGPAYIHYRSQTKALIPRVY